MSERIGLYGFGEVACVFAEEFIKAGSGDIVACVRSPKPQVDGVRQTTDLKDFTGNADIILSLVTPITAVDAAKAIQPHLTAKHFYVDLNSVSPDTKVGIAEIIQSSGARCVEGTIMAAVPKFRMKAPILLSGEHAPAARDFLARFGMEVEDIGPELGKASAVKMFRSLIIKGLEALVQECVLGAERFGAADRVLNSLNDTYGNIDWNELASFLISRTAIHGNRRAAEMDEVAATLRALGMEPTMAEASGKRIRALEPYGLKAVFGDTPPAHYRDVLKAIDEKN